MFLSILGLFGKVFFILHHFLLCCWSVALSCPTLWDSMDCSRPGFPVLHHFPELAQTHIHWVSDAIKPSCPLFSPSPPAFNLSQHQDLSQWIGSSHQVVKVLELQPSCRSFQWIFTIDFFYYWLVCFLAVPGIFKSLLQHHCWKASIFQCSAFFMAQLSHPYMTTEINQSFDYMELCQQIMPLPFNALSRFVIAFLQGISVF